MDSALTSLNDVTKSPLKANKTSKNSNIKTV